MKGALLLNGNARSPEELLRGTAPYLLGSRHEDEHVAAARNVLLVTAGWDREHDEAHVKRALNALGIASRYEDGFDRAIVNLSVRQEMAGVLGKSAALSSAMGELIGARDKVRRLYLAHNAHLVSMLRFALAEAKQLDERATLASLADTGESLRGAEPQSIYRFALGREIRQTLETLEDNDTRMVELSSELYDGATRASGAVYVPGYAEARARLERRILEANVIILFGGNLDQALGAMRFFRLGDALAEALRRGAVVVGSSAGAMLLCERVIVYDDFAHERREFQLWERGLGVVRTLQLFPHCMERIQTDDSDNLAYLARRFSHRVCVGLNEESFLFVDLASGRATSVGDEDAVYVFDPRGAKRAYRRGEEIDLDGRS